MTAVVALADPVDPDQRPVQRQVRPSLLRGSIKYLLQVRGVLGEHLDALVQVSIRGGDRQAGLGGENPQHRIVAEPPQDQFRWRAGRRRPPTGPGTDPVSVRLQ